MKLSTILCAVVTVLLVVCGVSQAATFSWSGTATGYYHDTTDAYFNPNTEGTTISGTLDISNMATGAVEMFGLIDKKQKDEGGSVWQSGAYLYVYKTATDVKVGTSDGNIGGEITTDATFVGAVDEIDFALNIQGGMINLTSSLFEGTKSRSYGAVKTYNNASGYEWDEFEYGAYLGGCVWPSSTVGYDVTATNAVPEPATLALLGLGGLCFRRMKKA